MVLSKPDIERYIKDRKLVIEPAPAHSRINQVSVDLRLGRKFTEMKKLPPHVPKVRVKRSLLESGESWDHTEGDSFDLLPGAFVLAQTLETVTMPPDLVGFVEGRSSWARVGIGIHMTAPKIDPGFSGTITLEMSNVGQMTVELDAEEDAPAQLILLKLTTPLDKADLYGASGDDRFQFQSDPVPRSEAAS